MEPSRETVSTNRQSKARRFASVCVLVLLGLPYSAAAQPNSSSAMVSTTDTGYSPLLGPNSEAYVDADALYQASCMTDVTYTWQLLPDGLLYNSYLAGTKESRISGLFFHERDAGWLLDVTLGGRAGILRYGTSDTLRPEGWQLDLEGAAFPRFDLEKNWDLVASDFRIGVPLTYSKGCFRGKLAYYHLSSHLGDELLTRTPTMLTSRINFSRDVLVLGGSYYPIASLRFYAEAGWAMASDGGSEPWEFQFGMEFLPECPRFLGGAPFLALNGHLREEIDFGGNLVAQTGWRWQGPTGHLLRLGAHYLNGPSNQFEFFRESEQQIGLGIWYDY